MQSTERYLFSQTSLIQSFESQIKPASSTLLNTKSLSLGGPPVAILDWFWLNIAPPTSRCKKNWWRQYFEVLVFHLTVDVAPRSIRHTVSTVLVCSVIWAITCPYATTCPFWLSALLYSELLFSGQLLFFPFLHFPQTVQPHVPPAEKCTAQATLIGCDM